MGRAAHVGFHAAYIEKEGRPSESGVGNALVGSYLTQIGLSEAAVVYITKAAPTEMTLLTLRDAEKIGIEVLPFDQQIPATKPDKRITSRETSNQEIANRARLFVKEIHSRSSGTNSVEWLSPLYAAEVNYYGKLISRGEVLARLRVTIERWPERSVSIQDRSMNAACNGRRPGFAQPVPQEVPMECVVTGTVNLTGRSLVRNAAVSAFASFTYVLSASGNRFVIKGEHGTILQHRYSPY